MRILYIIFLFLLAVPALVYSHSEHKPDKSKEVLEQFSAVEESYSVTAGNLPGITWVDDIHPIFIRNQCGHCHTREKEATVENLQEFALGIIDEKNPDNPFFSYHELIYLEGKPIFQQGETLRDGQCCWPKDYPIDQQRRIWLGHPERSVLLRKLDHDYYNWNSPPNTLQSGLKLLWGLPMPMWHPDKGQEYKSKSTIENYEIQPFWRRIGKTRKFTLPQPIPPIDRELIRHWIQNTLQIVSESNFRLTVEDASGKKMVDTKIYLVGNFTSHERHTISDIIMLTTNEKGQALLNFPEGSIVSATWYAFFEQPDAKKKHEKVHLVPGQTVDKTILF